MQIVFETVQGCVKTLQQIQAQREQIQVTKETSLHYCSTFSVYCGGVIYDFIS